MVMVLNLLPQYRSFITFSELGNRGRLGNQSFQYAAAKSYALKNNMSLFIPTDKEHKLGNFNISGIRIKKQYLKLLNKENFEQIGFHFDTAFYKYSKRIDINGSFQSEKYFIEHRDIFLREFILKDILKNDYCLQYIEKIRLENPGKSIVALHNRRGDNIPSKNKYSDKELGVFRPDKEAFHPLLSMDYIDKARSYFSGAVFLIFSDNTEDIQWFKDHIHGENHYYSEGHDDLTDLTLMKYCDHNIISNSTFSWWAAWLNENPDKKVIAPKKWFGDHYKSWSLKDLYPSNWILI